MQLYNCHVRLGNTITSEVPKYEVTAAEILIFRAIHGNDAVVRVQPIRQDRRAHAAERDRLEHEYGPGLRAQRITLESLFGHDHMPLPVSLDPEGEAKAAEAAAQREAEEAAKEAERKAEFDAAVEAEVAKRTGEQKANEAHARNNEPAEEPVEQPQKRGPGRPRKNAA